MGRSAFQPVAQEILVLRAGEGGLTGDQLVRDQGQAIHVGPRGHGSARDALRRDVPRGADELALLAVACRAGDAEVGELRVAALIDDHVRGLHIEVNETGLVRRVQCTRDLTNERRSLRDRDGPAFGHDVAERSAAYVLHDDERVVAVLPLVEDRHDVRVAHRRGAAGFGGEPLAERGIGLGAEDFHRHVALETQVAGPPHFGGPAAVDPLDEAVTVREDLLP